FYFCRAVLLAGTCECTTFGKGHYTQPFRLQYRGAAPAYATFVSRWRDCSDVPKRQLVCQYRRGNDRLSGHAARLRRPVRTVETFIQPCGRQVVYAVGRNTYKLSGIAVQGRSIVHTKVSLRPCRFAMECSRTQLHEARE